jgi:hypothetical protein
MRAQATLAASIGILLLCAACQRAETPVATAPPPAAPPTRISPEESAEARAALVAWFECDECTDGELESVVKIGDAAVPNLSGALEQGLSPSKREEARMHLVETYQELSKYAEKRKDDDTGMSEQQYVDTYLGNLESLYRVRSAVALERIGTPTARAALERGLKVAAEQRPELRGQIESEIKRANVKTAP